MLWRPYSTTGRTAYLMCKGEIKILAQDTEVAVAGHKEARFHYIRRNGLSIG